MSVDNLGGFYDGCVFCDDMDDIDDMYDIDNMYDIDSVDDSVASILVYE